MTRLPDLLLLLVSALPATLAYAALLGLGLHRHAPAAVISLTATALVFGPPLASAAMASVRRALVFGVVLLPWSVGLLLALPVYFPGERSQAVATGIALVGVGDGAARSVADALPGERPVAAPELPVATEYVQAEKITPLRLDDDQIALPFEGDGRRLAVPVAFEHDGTIVETTMMLDTGATYTTLPMSTLQQLGVDIGADAPSVVLHTANGQRDARIVLVDRLWLGNLPIDGVAVATCDPCASDETTGLLGLNVTGGYNLLIDGDRKEVVFSTRSDHNRQVDVSPFVKLDAGFTRFPGGRVEVDVAFRNTGARDVEHITAAVRCDAQHWLVDVHGVPAGQEVTARRRLPLHTPCERYQVSLHDASW